VKLFYVVTWIVLEKVFLIVVATGNRVKLTNLQDSKSWVFFEVALCCKVAKATK
jgi:hypothetical protein